MSSLFFHDCTHGRSLHNIATAEEEDRMWRARLMSLQFLEPIPLDQADDPMLYLSDPQMLALMQYVY